MDVLSAFEAELAAALRASPPLPFSEAEPESGLGTARALALLVARLSRQASGGRLSPDDQQRTFALALQQVDVDGQSVRQKGDKSNKPDISYLGDAGGTKRRVNIEIETGNINNHVAAVNRDPNAHNVFLKIDPWTGQIQGGLERVPGSTDTRPLTAAEAKKLVSQLPRPQRDPALSVHPKTKRQIRRVVRAPRVRPPQAVGGILRALRRGTREAEWENLLERAAREIEDN